MADDDGIWETDPPENTPTHTVPGEHKLLPSNAWLPPNQPISAEKKRGDLSLTEEDLEGHRNIAGVEQRDLPHVL